MTLSLPPLRLRLEPAATTGGPRIAPGTYPAVARLQQDGSLLLLIGQTRLRAPSATGISDGERLTVRLEQRGGTLSAEVVARERPPTPAPGAVDALRHLLPRQGDVAPAARAVLATAGAPDAGSLPDPVREALGALAAAVRRPADLADPDGLRQALRDSGSLYEWVLARFPDGAADAGRRDFAALLMRLAARLQRGGADPGEAAEPGPRSTGPQTAARLADLAGLADGALSRLRLLQLQPALGEPGLDLAFQLPVRDGDDVDDLYLRVRADPPADGNEAAADQRPLQVALVFDFAERGRLEARLRYQAGGISGGWWSDREGLRRAVEEALPLLRERLEAAGLAVGRLGIHAGQPPALPDDVRRPRGGLIHESV